MIRPIFYFYLLNKHKIINYLTNKDKKEQTINLPIYYKPYMTKEFLTRTPYNYNIYINKIKLN